MAASVPFGVFAPAEYYDFEVMQAGRGDASYYASLNTGDVHKFGPPVNILQVHVPTATEEGTLASLTRRYTRLAERIRSGAELTPDEKLFLGYDAVQLLPVEPTTVYETGLDFWTETEVDDDTVEVALARPDTTNWGYDVVLAGMGTGGTLSGCGRYFNALRHTVSDRIAGTWPMMATFSYKALVTS